MTDRAIVRNGLVAVCLVVVVGLGMMMLLAGAANANAGSAGADVASHTEPVPDLERFDTEPTQNVTSASQDPSVVVIDEEVLEADGTTEIVVRFDEHDSSDVEALKEHAERSQRPLKRLAENREDVEILNQFWLTNAVVLRVDTDRLSAERLATVEGVEELHANFEVEADESTAAGVVTRSPQDSSRVHPIGSSDAVDSESYDTTYGLEQIDAPGAWQAYDTKGSSIRVAVLDTGVNISHPDLDLYTEDPNDSTYSGGWAEFDDDGNRIYGSEPYDSHYHGTHVSGTVVGGDASGQYIGVAPEADLMHGLVLRDGGGTFASVVSGMEWAVEKDAHVISMSMGAGGYYSTFIDPIRNAQNQGIVVVASAGNSGEGSSTTPGNEYDLIGVGASDQGEGIASFSSGEKIDTQDDWGSDASDDWPDEYIVPSVAAPGAGIWSADAEGGYRDASGTSMAAPHVAGAVALIQSATDEHHSPDEIKDAIQQTAWKPDDWDEDDAEDSIDGQDTRYGHGIIHVTAAIEYLSEDQPEFEVSDAELTEDTILEGETAEVTATVENVGDEEGDFEAEFHVTDEDGVIQLLDSKTVSLAPGESTTVTLSGTVEEAGTYQADVSGMSTPKELTVERPATFELSGGSLSDDSITEGESVEVSATVENVGDREGTFTAELEVDGHVEATTDVTLAGGASDTVTFSYEPPDAGEYELVVAGDDGDDDRTQTHAGTLEVLEPAEFEVWDATLSETKIFEGDSVEVTATVENTGEVEDTFTAELEVELADSSVEVRATEDVTLAGGESTMVVFDETFESAGTYEISVSGEHAGTLTVEEPTPAEFETSDVTLGENPIEEGDSVDVEATVENVGDESGEHTATLYVDGEERATETIELEGGASTSVTFTEMFETVGEYEVTVDDAPAVTLTVEQPATFEVGEASLDETTITEGESVEVAADVENVGDRDGTFTAELVVDGAVVDTQDVHVEAGSAETVSFVESFADPGEYEIEVNDAHAGTLTVEEEPEADLEVTEADLESSTITEGEYVEVMATVENTGDSEGSMTVNLVVDGTVEESTEITVPANDATTVTFTYEPSDPGEYEFGVNDVHAGTLTVEEEPEASFEVSEATLSDGTIEAGESVDATATVENVGDAEGSYEVELVVDGQTVETVTVTLDAGESTTVQFSRTFDDAGEYEIAVDDTHAGTLEVLASADVEVTDASLDTEAIEEGESIAATVELTNAGDVDGEITVTVDFGDGTTVDRTVPVAGGATVTETVEHTYDVAGEYEVTAEGVTAGTVTVSEPSPAELSVVDATLDPETMLEGETTTVEATVENVGDETGELVVELQLDDAVYDSTTVTLAPGEAETIVLEATVADAGEYDVSVDEVHVGTLTVRAPADLEVVDASLADDEITVGESVEVTGEVENTGDVAGTLAVDLEVDGVIVATTEVEVKAGDVATVTFEWTADEEGDVPVYLNEVYAGTVAVAEEDSADDGDDADDGASGGGGGGAGGGGAGGGGAGGAAPPPADDPEEETDTETEPSLTTVEATDGGASIMVNDTAAGETVSLDVRDAVLNVSVAGGDLTLDGLAIDVGDGAGAFELDVALLTAEPQKGPDLREHGDWYVGLAYVSIETGVDNADLDEVRFQFTVPSASLPKVASPTDVTIVRYDGETWQELETVHEGGETYSAVSPGFSEFAVAVPASVGAEGEADAAAFEVLDVDVSESSVFEGERTTVTALVENVGEATDTFTAELTVDGEIRATRDVTLGPGESEDVEFAPSFAEPGTYKVSVSGIDESFTVTVEPVDTSESASTDPEDDSGSGIADREFPMGLLAAGGLVALVLLIGGVAVVVRGGVEMESVADGSVSESAETRQTDGNGSETEFVSGTHSSQSRGTDGHSLPDESQADDGGFQWAGDD